MIRTAIFSAAALAAAVPALAQEAAPPPPPEAIPAEDVIPPPEITAEEEAVIEMDPARRYRTATEIKEARADVAEAVDGAREQATARAAREAAAAAPVPAKTVTVAAVEPAAAPPPAQGGVVRHARAWLANADHLSFLPDAQKALVGQLAYAAAAANLCEGVRLAPGPVTDAFAQLAPDASLDAGAKRQFERRLLVAYGVAVGLMMADHESNLPAFCQDAADAASGGGELYLAVAR